jgi:hypothetical protein
MSYKEFSAAQDALSKAWSAQGTPDKDSPDDKSKAAPAANQPAAQPDKTPAKAAPARKS